VSNKGKKNNWIETPFAPPSIGQPQPHHGWMVSPKHTWNAANRRTFYYGRIHTTATQISRTTCTTPTDSTRMSKLPSDREHYKTHLLVESTSSRLITTDTGRRIRTGMTNQICGQNAHPHILCNIFFLLQARFFFSVQRVFSPIPPQPFIQNGIKQPKTFIVLISTYLGKPEL
jgi:hypothetical protein